jgi:hypothetical protein
MTKKKDPIKADPIDERQEAIRESRKWKKELNENLKETPAPVLDERQEAIRESRKWSKSIAKVVKKVKKKCK